MNDINHIHENFFHYFLQLKFKVKSLDYSVINNHSPLLQMLSDIGNSGSGIFDLHKREVIFYSSNFGTLLGYEYAEYKDFRQPFFASKIHPNDAFKRSINGISVLKLLNSFSRPEKLGHKLITEC